MGSPVPTREPDWALALPVGAQEGSPRLLRARRRARTLVAIVLALSMSFVALIGSVLWREAKSESCWILKFEQGIRGDPRPDWSGWPPGWTCVFETNDGSVLTRYIGF